VLALQVLFYFNWGRTRSRLSCMAGIEASPYAASVAHTQVTEHQPHSNAAVRGERSTLLLGDNLHALLGGGVVPIGDLSGFARHQVRYEIVGRVVSLSSISRDRTNSVWALSGHTVWAPAVG
jgi:hypothetical protein